MSHGISERTRRGGYSAYAAEWRRFAEERGVEAGNPPPEEVLEWLLHVQQRTRSGRTVGKARAAAAHWATESGSCVAPFRDPTVDLFCTAACRLKPATPMLQCVFDVPELLSRLALVPGVQCPGGVQTRAALLAMLLGPWRLADVLSARPSRVTRRGSQVYFLLQPKEERGGLQWRVQDVATDPRVCAVSALSEAGARPLAQRLDTFFLKGDRAATDDELRKDVQALMVQLGLHRAWTPHTCRAAGANAMVTAGVDLVTVCRRGGWKTFDSFFRSYLRVFRPGNAADAIGALLHLQTH